MSDKTPPLCDQPKWNNIRHRCCCVFDHDSDKDEPLAECYYHERIRARLAEAEERLVAARYLIDGLLNVRDPFIRVKATEWLRAADSADEVQL